MLKQYAVATWTVVVIATTVPLSAQDYTIVAMSHTSNGIHEIDPATGTILQEYRVPGEWFGEPHEGAISPDGKTVYASIPYKKQVIVLDGSTFKPIKVIESEFFLTTDGNAQLRASRPARNDIGRPPRIGAQQ